MYAIVLCWCIDKACNLIVLILSMLFSDLYEKISIPEFPEFGIPEKRNPGIPRDPGFRNLGPDCIP